MNSLAGKRASGVLERKEDSGVGWEGYSGEWKLNPFLLVWNIFRDLTREILKGQRMRYFLRMLKRMFIHALKPHPKCLTLRYGM